MSRAVKRNTLCNNNNNNNNNNNSNNNNSNDNNNYYGWEMKNYERGEESYCSCCRVPFT